MTFCAVGQTCSERFLIVKLPFFFSRTSKAPLSAREAGAEEEGGEKMLAAADDDEVANKS